MQRKFLILMVLAIPLLIIAMKDSRTKSVPLIPRDILFGNPVKASPQLSPDGRFIAYYAPLSNNNEKEVLNIWVKSIDKNDDKPVTSFVERQCSSFFWSHDSKEIFYVMDTKGDENWHLYSIRLDTKETIEYTPFKNTMIQIIDYNDKSPDYMIIAHNQADPKLFDLYRLNLKTKKIERICKNPGGVIQWIVDEKGNVKAAVQDTKAGQRQIILYNKGAWKPLRTYSCEDTQNNCHSVAYYEKENKILMFESKDYSTARLVAIDCATGKPTVLAEDPGYDMTDVYKYHITDEVEAVLCNRDKPEWIVLNKRAPSAAVFEKFKDMGSMSIVSTDDKRKLWIIAVGKDTSTVTYYLFDGVTTKELFKARPNLPEEHLVPMEPISYKSRDGLTIHGYLLKPRIGTAPYPLVLDVHGGPNARDSWGYDPRAQWFANRGYAVLKVNYRGSLGYGKDFINAANKEWGGKMHDDLIDGVNWALQSGVADKKKVAIYGASYGGYAALVGATFTPDVFCCAIDHVGPCNLISFLKSIPPYWEVFRAQINTSIGNPDTEEEFLRSRSPLFKVDAIKIPMLIAQGANDPRVKQAEAEQIVAALKKNNIPHEYMLFPDEGHGFSKAHNRIKYYAAVEAFLARYLGGRCEP